MSGPEPTGAAEALSQDLDMAVPDVRDAPDVPDVSILIVTFECARFITACLDAVAATVVGHRYEVVVADNASTDDSAGVVRRARPDAIVMDMGANTGFARAVNAAMAASTGRLLLLLNPDTEVCPGAIDTLVRAADALPDAGVVAPMLLNSDGTDQGTARSFPTPSAALLGRRSPLTRLFPGNRWSRRYLLGRDHRGSGTFAVDWVSGACLLTPRSVALELGGLDEGFFMHFEDADYCHRVKRSGRPVWCVPTARVVHHEGGSRRGWPPSQVRHFHYGAYRYWTKHHAPQWWNPLRPAAGTALALRAAAVIGANRIRARRIVPTTVASRGRWSGKSPGNRALLGLDDATDQATTRATTQTTQTTQTTKRTTDEMDVAS